MKNQSKIREYFQFTRKDRIAAIIIALILMTTFLLPTVLENRKTGSIPTTDTAWISAIRQLEKPAAEKNRPRYDGDINNTGDENYTRDRAADGYNNGARAELFSFDPNTLDADGWKRLGLREKTIGTILKYREKGGWFRKPEDLQRIYGLPASLYEKLRPYIVIAGKSSSTPSSPTPGYTEKLTYPTPRTAEVVDINSADSTALEALPGIGATLAMRIIRFREKLGGFYSIDQVRETFGLADSAFQKIRPFLRNENKPVKQIDINKAGIEELKAHPYIRYNIGNIIIQYRNQHGQYASVNELKNITAIEKASFEKMQPYLLVTN